LGRSRRRHNSPPFRAWGLLLTILLTLLVIKGLWSPAVVVTGVLAFYLLVVRLTRCRVETTVHRPCRWRVRGLLGTCDYHTGYKRGLPILARGDGIFALPMFMWRRPDFIPNPAPEPQPTSTANATIARADRPGYDWIMMGLAGVSLLVAIAAFIRDLVAG
jgi:hypothetical protein